MTQWGPTAQSVQDAGLSRWVPYAIIAIRQCVPMKAPGNISTALTASCLQIPSKASKWSSWRVQQSAALAAQAKEGVS